MYDFSFISNKNIPTPIFLISVISFLTNFTKNLEILNFINFIFYAALKMLIQLLTNYFSSTDLKRNFKIASSFKFENIMSFIL